MALEQVFECPSTLAKLRSAPLGKLLDDFCKWLLDHGFSRGTTRLHLGRLRHLNEHLRCPRSGTVSEVLGQYVEKRQPLGPGERGAPLFLDHRGRHLCRPTVYAAFRRLLRQCGIPHHRDAGPRIHDLRHTFAVHRLLAWYRDSQDVNARLPWLATYLGHVDIRFP